MTDNLIDAALRTQHPTPQPTPQPTPAPHEPTVNLIDSALSHHAQSPHAPAQDPIDATLGAIGGAIQHGKQEVWNALKPLHPVLTGAARAIGTVANPIFSALNAPLESNLEHHVHGGGLNIWEEPQAHDPQRFRQNVETATMQMMGATPQEYAKLPHWRRAANEFATQFLYDPLSFIGGAGLTEEVAGKVARYGAVNTARGIHALQISENPSVRDAGHALATAYDALHFKGAAQRGLAVRGEQGIDQFSGLKAINNRRRMMGSDLETTLLSQYHKTIAGLTPGEEGQLYEAVHTGAVDALPPNLRVRAAQFKQITDQMAHLGGDPELQSRLGEQGFELPSTMQRFQADEPRGIQTAEQYRQNYVPTAHNPAQEAANAAQVEEPGILGLDRSRETGSGRSGGTVVDQLHVNEPPLKQQGDQRSLQDILTDSRLSPAEKQQQLLGKAAEDPFLKERGEGAQMLAPDLQRRVIERRLRSGSRAIAAADAEKAVAKLFGKETFQQVPREAKDFFVEAYREPGGAESLKNFIKAGIDIPKVGLFALPFRHMANIGSLLALADPSVLPTAFGKYARLMVQNTGVERLDNALAKRFKYFEPENVAARRSNILGESQKYGVTGLRGGESNTGWVGRIPIIGDVYKASNHALWTFDDAAKAVRFDKLRKQYMGRGLDESTAAYRAADQVGGELIDYSNRSPLTQFLSYVAPFATYRSKLPGAVGRTLITHPERIRQAGALSPELVGDVQQMDPNAKGVPQVGKSNLPLADVLRGAANPMEYARTTAGWPTQMAASGIMGAVENAAGRVDPESANYFTYGKNPDAKYALNALVGSFPGGGAALNAAHLGEFTNEGSLSGALRAQTGFTQTRGPFPSEIMLANFLQRNRLQAAAARAKGNAPLADLLDKQYDYYRRRYHSYIP